MMSKPVASFILDDMMEANGCGIASETIELAIEFSLKYFGSYFVGGRAVKISRDADGADELACCVPGYTSRLPATAFSPQP